MALGFLIDADVDDFGGDGLVVVIFIAIGEVGNGSVLTPERGAAETRACCFGFCCCCGCGCD